jgi:hypothetical protein
MLWPKKGLLALLCQVTKYPQYRKSEKFLKTFEEVFREPFELVVTEATEPITHSGDFIQVAIDKKDFPLDTDLTQLANYPGGILGSLWQAVQDRTQFMDLAIVRESEVSQPENHSGDNVQESQ